MIENLRILESSEEQAMIESMLKTNPPLLTKDQLIRLANMPTVELEKSLEALAKEGKIALVRNKIVHAETLEVWKQNLRKKIDTTFGDRIYISKGEFVQSLPISKDAAVAEAVLKQLETEGIIELEAEKIKLLTRLDRLVDWRNKIETVYKESSYQPPGLEELKSRIGAEGMWVNDLLSVLEEDGVLARIAPGMVFHRAVVNQSIQILKDHLKSHPGITVSEFRQLLGTSRKYALPLLEYFDSVGITVRDGDIRRLKGVRS